MLNITDDSYTFDFPEELNNVFSIELVSYSLPIPSYNINKYNNTLEYQIDDDKVSINIKPGLYTIKQLLKELGKQSSISFNLNSGQMVVVKNTSKFSLHPTKLTTTLLGFGEELLDGKKEYIAGKMWDLRKNNYVILRLDNIDPDSGFAILDYNGHSTGKIELEESIALNKLSIRFTDYNEDPIDFNGLYHTLHFKVKCYNKPIQIDFSRNREESINKQEIIHTNPTTLETIVEQPTL